MYEVLRMLRRNIGRSASGLSPGGRAITGVMNARGTIDRDGLLNHITDL